MESLPRFTPILPRDVVAVEPAVLFSGAYDQEPFVRLLGDERLPDTKNVVGTNFIDIAWKIDKRTQSSHCHERDRQHRQRRERSGGAMFQSDVRISRNRGVTVKDARISGSARVSRAAFDVVAENNSACDRPGVRLARVAKLLQREGACAPRISDDASSTMNANADLQNNPRLDLRAARFQMRGGFLRHQKTRHRQRFGKRPQSTILRSSFPMCQPRSPECSRRIRFAPRR